VTVENKVDQDASIKLLMSLGRIDKEKKLIKTVKAEEKKDDTTLMTIEVPYSTLADLGIDELAEYEKKERERISFEARNQDISVDKVLTKEIQGLEPVEVSKIKTFWQGQKERLSYERELGTVVDAESVREQQFLVARVLRDSFLSLPRRVVPLMLGVRDQHEMTRILEQEINRILENLSK